jgi:diguanylate cyclase (GGDEF)-like protein
MNMDATKSRETDQRFHERLRASALWIGSLGFLVNALAYWALYLLGDATPLLTAEVSAYAIVLATIVLCSYRDLYVRAVLFSGLVVIYAIFWIAAFAYAWQGDHIALALPLVLFVPLLLTIALPYWVLFVMAPVQAIAVFAYATEHALPALEVGWPVAEQFALGAGLGAFSGATILAFALMSIERATADRKLVALVAEKHRIASVDSLTELLNRRAFMAYLEEHWPPTELLTIAFIDLDHFKPLNDQYGHAMGDFVLKEVADRLRAVSGSCAVARLGGDEFALCCIGPDAERPASALAAELHNRISAEFQTEIGPISMSASVGYAIYDQDIGSLSKLLRAADAAMRRAKVTRSGWATFSHGTDGAALATTSIEFELKSALRGGQIRAAIQPIAHTADLRVVEYELLSRWVDSGFETDPGPAQFIPVAEKLGLLNEILWVTLSEALTALNLAHVRLSINISPAQLLASDFLDSLMEVLAQHAVDPDRITLEVTEEVVFRNLDKNVAVLERARNAGMLVALDDFGSGYSSLGMLDALPLDKLKIDRSLVQKARHSERSANILAAAVKLALQLDLVACVEGVESEEEFNTVLPLGAQQLQGFWIGRPALVRDGVAQIGKDAPTTVFGSR